MDKNLQQSFTIMTAVGIGVLTAVLASPSAVLAQALVPHRAASTSVPQAVPGQVLIKVPDTYTDEQVAALADSAGCVVTISLPYSPHYYLLTTKGRSAKTGARTRAVEPSGIQDDVLSAVMALQQTPGVLASPNYMRSPMGLRRQSTPPVTVVPNDPLYGPSTVSSTGQQWHYSAINMPQAWAIQSNKALRTIRVGIIDTGIDLTHPDLKNKLLAGGMDFSPLGGATPGPAVAISGDPDGHGTHVSGTVAAEGNNGIGVTGVAGWNRNGVDVKIIPLAVFAANGSSSDAALIAAVNYAVQQNVDVVNMSLGGLGNDPVFASAITTAYTAGMTLVAAAGNSSSDNKITPVFPATYPEVIAVSAVGPSKTLTSYSNYGGNVAIAAPGGDVDNNATSLDPATLILSTFPLALAGTSPEGYPISPVAGYQTLAGTSQASPHVTGVVALLLAAGIGRNPAKIKSVIQSSATVLDEVPNINGGNKYGAGLLNAYAALKAIGSIPGFTAQLSEVVDTQTNLINTPGASSSTSTNVATRSLTYGRRQTGIKVTFVAGSAPTTAAGAARSKVRIESVALGNQLVAEYTGTLGGGDFNLTPPATAAPTDSVQTTVPASGQLSLPYGRYRVVLLYDNVPQGYVFFEVARRIQPKGRTLFASPFTTSDAPDTPEQYLFGALASSSSVSYYLRRYNPARLSTQGDYFSFNNDSSNPITDSQASLTRPTASDGSPLTTFNSALSTSIAPIGLGYWLTLNQDVELNPTGPTVSTPVAVKLFSSNSGWNMIGDPYTFAVNWSAATILVNGRSYTLTEAIDANIIANALVGWNGSEYLYNIAPLGTFDAFNGYWIRAYQDCTIIIPPTPAGTATDATSTRSSRLPTINGWRARLIASVAGDRDGENYFGEVADATGRAARYDVVKPPTGAGHAYVRFVKQNPSGRSEWYAFDMRATSETHRQEWSAAVSTDRTNADVTLSWDGIGSAPRGTDLYLTDTETGAKVSLRDRSTYRFRSGEAGSTRVFKIASEPRVSAGPLAITNLSLSGGRALQGGVTLRLATTREAQVQGTVTTLTGA